MLFPFLLPLGQRRLLVAHGFVRRGKGGVQLREALLVSPAGHGHQGRHVAGVYPLLTDETCWFLATDFDKTSWTDDVAAFVETCRVNRLPAAIERSRSGNGAHVIITDDLIDGRGYHQFGDGQDFRPLAAIHAATGGHS